MISFFTQQLHIESFLFVQIQHNSAKEDPRKLPGTYSLQLNRIFFHWITSSQRLDSCIFCIIKNEV